MSEKIADAIREVLEVHGNKMYSQYKANAVLEVRDILFDIANAIDRRTRQDPGGEESTEDKPF